jgi:hypothetical protein
VHWAGRSVGFGEGWGLCKLSKGLVVCATVHNGSIRDWTLIGLGDQCRYAGKIAMGVDMYGKLALCYGPVGLRLVRGG